jgi:hypothetical protein
MVAVVCAGDPRPCQTVGVTMENSGVLITWSFENWVTVVLMAALGYMAFALVTQFYKNGGVGAYVKS